METVIVSWNGGKDSALSLLEILKTQIKKTDSNPAHNSDRGLRSEQHARRAKDFARAPGGSVGLSAGKGAHPKKCVFL